MVISPDTQVDIRNNIKPDQTDYIVGKPEHIFSSTVVDHLTKILAATPNLDKNRAAQAIYDLETFQNRLYNNIIAARENIQKGIITTNPDAHSVTDYLMRTGKVKNHLRLLAEYQPSNDTRDTEGRIRVESPSHPASDLYEQGVMLEAFGMLPQGVTAETVQDALHSAKIVVCRGQEQIDKAVQEAEASRTLTILEYRDGNGQFAGRFAAGFRNETLGVNARMAIKYDARNKKPIPRNTDLTVTFDPRVIYQTAEQTPDTRRDITPPPQIKE